MRLNIFSTASALGLLALGGLLTGTALANDRLIEEQRALNHDARLIISNVAGEIRVTGWDKPLMDLRAVPGLAFEDLQITGDANDLRVEVKVPKKARNVDGTELELSVPHSVKLIVDAVSADVIVRELSGPLELKTVSGDVSSHAHSRQVRIKTVSGDIVLEAPSERTELGSVSGDIEARGLLGELDAETVSGSVDLQMVEVRRLTGKAVSGDLELRVDRLKDARIKAETLSGDVQLWLPKDSNADIEMGTFSGDLSSALGPSVKRGAANHEFILGKGGSRIDLNSFSGDVELRGR